MPCPCGEGTAYPCLHRSRPALACSSGSVSYGLTAAFPWVLVCTRFCLCPPRMEALFLRFPGASYSLSWIPGWNVWHGAQNLYDSGTASLILLFSSLWVAHSASMGYILLCLRPSYYLNCGFSFAFGCGLSFFDGFQSPLFNGSWIASCDFGAVNGGGECRIFYSAILNQSPISYLNWNIPIKLSIHLKECFLCVTYLLVHSCYP